MKNKKYFILGGMGVMAFLCIFLACFLLYGSNKKYAGKAEISGMKDIEVEQGSKLPDLTEGVEKTDAVAWIMVDTSAVDIDTPGIYPIVYRYEDKAGEKYEISINCTVLTSATESSVNTEAVQESEAESEPALENEQVMEEATESNSEEAVVLGKG